MSLPLLEKFRNVQYEYVDKDDTFIARGLQLNMLRDQMNEAITLVNDTLGDESSLNLENMNLSDTLTVDIISEYTTDNGISLVDNTSITGKLLVDSSDVAEISDFSDGIYHTKIYTGTNGTTGLRNEITYAGTGTTYWQYGVYNHISLTGNVSISNTAGIYNYISNDGPDVTGQIRGLNNFVKQFLGSTATEIFGEKTRVLNQSTTNTGDIYGIRVQMDNQGTCANEYGLYILGVGQGTASGDQYGIYVETTADNYFTGDLEAANLTSGDTVYAISFSGTDGTFTSQINVDTIYENGTGNGVTIDGVLLQDNEVAWSYIGSTPTTIAGYGITDTNSYGGLYQIPTTNGTFDDFAYDANFTFNTGTDTLFTPNISLETGATVNEVETAITDDDTHIATSGAIVDYVTGRATYAYSTDGSPSAGGGGEITVLEDTSITNAVYEAADVIKVEAKADYECGSAVTAQIILYMGTTAIFTENTTTASTNMDMHIEILLGPGDTSTAWVLTVWGNGIDQIHTDGVASHGSGDTLKLVMITNGADFTNTEPRIQLVQVFKNPV